MVATMCSCFAALSLPPPPPPRDVEARSSWNSSGLRHRELSLSEPNLHELGEGGGEGTRVALIGEYTTFWFL